MYTRTLQVAIYLLAGIFYAYPSRKPVTSLPAPLPVSNYKMVAYIAGDRRLELEDIDAGRLTHINYAFVEYAEGEVRSYLSRDEHNLEVLRKLREKYPHLKLLVSIGGWNKSRYFSDAALTEASRTHFAWKAVEFMKKHGLDGLDIDWEYPGMPAGGNIYRKEDKENFTLLLEKTRYYLDQLTEMEGRYDNPYLLTIAGGAGPYYFDKVEVEKIHTSIDFINLMAYNFVAEGNKFTGHHANLYPSTIGKGSRFDAAKVVENYANACVPLHKLVLGVAFYGRGWQSVSPGNTGLYQASEGHMGSFAFHTLSQEYMNQRGFTRHWDTLAKAPYLWNDQTRIFITYEDSLSLAYKSRYIKEKQLGGVMFWEYYKDTTGVLLQTLNTHLHTERRYQLNTSPRSGM